ncbi:ABC transporter substrate-binding protein [Phytohabitans suffuscus]|uniref:Leucine-binding protein domain-containing protein n=1 Tax=Phytohabitans suffuscus TaxID=624315 RepID=A0A6F8YR53_9ACTN|nr:ABC transporter substrate-binding protein [Phytohabitans suffuscus]BCB88630.1 hypothetical protein Psuf_059430 [Phytohabitans suffuscus]
MPPTLNKLRWRAALMTAAVALTAACSSTDGEGSSGADEPFRMLLIAPLSGALADSGAAMRAGFSAAVDVVNANGGVNGRQVELTVKDSRGEATEIASVLNGALASDNPPDFVQPGLTTPEAAAALPLIKQAGLLAGSTAASTSFQSSKEHPLFISPTPINGDSAYAAVEHLAEKGFKSMALVVVDNESGVASIEPYQAAAKQKGITVTGVERVAADIVNATANLDRLRAGNPDVLMLGAFGAHNKPVIDSVRLLDWDVPIWGDNSVAGTNLARLMGDDKLGGITLVAPAYTVADTPVTNGEVFQKAMDAIRAKAGGTLTQALPIYINPYRLVILVKYLAEVAGSTDGEAMYEARTKLKAEDALLYPGASKFWTDPEDNFMDYGPEDYVAVPAGPFVDGLIKQS